VQLNSLNVHLNRSYKNLVEVVIIQKVSLSLNVLLSFSSVIHSSCPTCPSVSCHLICLKAVYDSADLVMVPHHLLYDHVHVLERETERNLLIHAATLCRASILQSLFMHRPLAVKPFSLLLINYPGRDTEKVCEERMTTIKALPPALHSCHCVLVLFITWISLSRRCECIVPAQQAFIVIESATY